MEKNLKINAKDLKLSDFDNKELDVKITKILNIFGISQKYGGFSFLRSAVKMCTMCEVLQQQIVKVVYQVIAQEYDTTASGVERAIRHYISILWQKADVDLLSMYIPCANGRGDKPPTNADVIATLSDNLRIGLYDDIL